MTFTPDHRPRRKLLVSAGHTTTADSEHNLNCSFCCRFQRHSLLSISYSSPNIPSVLEAHVRTALPPMLSFKNGQ